MTPLRQRLSEAYSGNTVCVTGGASFIGSHLVDALCDLDADVVVIDDFSSGSRANLPGFDSDRILELDLADRAATIAFFPEAEYVFHLAAVHGGRGFIDSYPQQVLVNLAIDNNLLTAAAARGVRHVIHASSACVYPVTLQASTTDRRLLSEAQANFVEPGSAYADGAYGWTKLMGEYQLSQFAQQGTFQGSSARIFTAYGERENESHAAIALMAKALLRCDPFPIWGDGQQTRNFTYVADTVQGMLLLGTLNAPGTFRAANVGSGVHHTVLDFLDAIFAEVGWSPNELERQTWRPVGVASRASDNALMRALFDWEPTVSIDEGVARTLEWYARRHDRPASESELEAVLLSR
ncbi:MAG: NAD-dependent epimerase/dehydratase family protein [Solirubrobacteraceae bacterium]|jgi:UDP-glucose 4-epimerase